MLVAVMLQTVASNSGERVTTGSAMIEVCRNRRQWRHCRMLIVFEWDNRTIAMQSQVAIFFKFQLLNAPVRRW